jgi:adenylosuccinate synthase
MEWKNLTLTRVYGAEPYTQEMLECWVRDFCEPILPYICDTGALLRDAQRRAKAFCSRPSSARCATWISAFFPYTTSSHTTAAFAAVGSGLSSLQLTDVIGVVKAYSTCVGEGPFVCEMFGGEAEKLREAGAEYGAKTGRPRRVGPIDLVATRYGVEVQAATALALTKLDVLSYMEKIPSVSVTRSMGGNGSLSVPDGPRKGCAGAYIHGGVAV